MNDGATKLAAKVTKLYEIVGDCLAFIKSQASVNATVLIKMHKTEERLAALEGKSDELGT